MELLDRMLFWDLEGYLPDNILRKVDRSTMAFSLEGREPLLDYRIIEYMGSIRPEVKIVGNELKYLLKRVSHNYIPKRLLDRPKKGFNAPVLRWMRGCLKDMIIEILSEERILASPILKTDAVLGMRDKVISGAYDDYRKLWTIFIYENWLQNNCK
jgi:asparagine synthase (glutamine-hydrolysing)